MAGGAGESGSADGESRSVAGGGAGADSGLGGSTGGAHAGSAGATGSNGGAAGAAVEGEPCPEVSNLELSGFTLDSSAGPEGVVRLHVSAKNTAASGAGSSTGSIEYPTAIVTCRESSGSASSASNSNQLFELPAGASTVFNFAVKLSASASHGSTVECSVRRSLLNQKNCTDAPVLSTAFTVE